MHAPDAAQTPADRRPAAAVWAVWAVCSLGAIGYTLRFGSDMPQWDEDQYVPVLTGHRAPSWSWFLERHGDHLIVIPKALYLATVGVFGDFRAGALLSGLLMSAATALLLVAARRRRGRTEYGDALLPLLSLSWGRAANLLSSEQLQYTASVVIQAALLALTVTGMATRRAIGTSFVLLMLLPLCGGQGLALVPALALAVVVTGWHGAAPRRWLLAAGAIPFVAALAMIALHRPHFETTHDAGRVATTMAQFLGLAAGPSGRYGWPGTMIGTGRPPLVTIAVLALAAVVAGMLVRAARRDPARHCAAAALLLHLMAMGTLALVIGIGRGGLEPNAGLEDRYATIALPLLWVVYFAWDAFSPAPARRPALAAMLAAATLVHLFGDWCGVVQGRARREKMEAAAQALRSDEAREAIAARFSPFLHPDPAFLVWEFGALQEARLGPFRRPR